VFLLCRKSGNAQTRHLPESSQSHRITFDAVGLEKNSNCHNHPEDSASISSGEKKPAIKAGFGAA
jgi:hypothetical protein